MIVSPSPKKTLLKWEQEKEKEKEEEEEGGEEETLQKKKNELGRESWADKRIQPIFPRKKVDGNGLMGTTD